MPDKPIQVIIPKDINIHIHQYDHRSKNGEEKIIELVGLVLNKLNKIMANQTEQFADIMNRLNSVTNDIATDYQTLLNAVQDKIPQEDFDKATANIAKLELLGASVENPVPEVIPPVVEGEGGGEGE